MGFENKYSFLDKMLHRIAFSSWTAQAAIAETESAKYSEQLSKIEVSSPVFITSLPRAGTTLLLEICHSLPEFSSHNYRNMPFVLIPLLWNKFSQSFHQQEAPQERAHGDGMMVDYDSPEAFEEIVWRTFWPKQYKKLFIDVWPRNRDKDFESFFTDHIRKIIILDKNEDKQNLRYVSKNNLNITRVNYLKKVFPDSNTIVMFREPVAHATSLLKQHLNFLEMHRDDSFAKKYMASIGHYDFGENLKPVNFSNWLNETPYNDHTTLEFWLSYWCACYEYLIENSKDSASFLSYDQLSAEPNLGLEIIAKKIQVNDIDEFKSHAKRFRAPTPHDINLEAIPQQLLDNVEVTYSRLLSLSIV